jgi:hypothetical protein
VGRVVRSSWDHRRRTVGHRPLKAGTAHYTLQASGATLASAMTFPLVTPLSWSGLAASFPIGSRLARLHSSLMSVNPDLMIAQDAFRAHLALLQGVVPFDVAGARQLLTGTI